MKSKYDLDCYCCEWDLGLKCSWLSYLLSEVYVFIPAMKKKKCICSPPKKFLYIWSGVEYEYTPWSGMAWKNIMFHESISINRPTHLRCLVAKFSSSIALCWNWKQYLLNHYYKEYFLNIYLPKKYLYRISICITRLSIWPLPLILSSKENFHLLLFIIKLSTACYERN